MVDRRQTYSHSQKRYERREESYNIWSFLYRGVITIGDTIHFSELSFSMQTEEKNLLLSSRQTHKDSTYCNKYGLIMSTHFFQKVFPPHSFQQKKPLYFLFQTLFSTNQKEERTLPLNFCLDEFFFCCVLFEGYCV